MCQFRQKMKQQYIVHNTSVRLEDRLGNKFMVSDEMPQSFLVHHSGLDHKIQIAILLHKYVLPGARFEINIPYALRLEMIRLFKNSRFTVNRIRKESVAASSYYRASTEHNHAHSNKEIDVVVKTNSLIFGQEKVETKSATVEVPSASVTPFSTPPSNDAEIETDLKLEGQSFPTIIASADNVDNDDDENNGDNDNDDNNGNNGKHRVGLALARPSLPIDATFDDLTEEDIIFLFDKILRELLSLMRDSYFRFATTDAYRKWTEIYNKTVQNDKNEFNVIVSNFNQLK
ncbi:hypothetical protein RFI_30751 [Reticulomyxa filosa]|uniref:Uncharacterized protein n=1 Tax=Reticulomyxa filosa TaxID=46433 RepID=X6LZQ1_RETFI|nr:hypothetical protein RFI_30751 [Reticulomyxa filosa]|eukprot:ETO06642.1 hypothetical protein RFI_30751 [Reticulomyxa filosa]